MPKFTVIIDTDNDTFKGEPEREVARILRQLANSITVQGAEAGIEHTLKDINGNDCGSWYMSE